MASSGDGGPRWRVFISHTSELQDFPSGRSYVAKVKEAISAAGHVIVDMADFPAADQPPAQLCTDRVRGCEVYVGALGTRYGSPVRDRPDVSYTELEFDAATEAGLDRLVFLLDTDAADVGIPLSKLIDHELGARQDAFRRRVQNSGLVTQSFADPGTLGQLVERSLQELAKTRARINSGIVQEQVCAVREVPFPLAARQPDQSVPTAEDSGSWPPRLGLDGEQIVVGNIPCKPPGYRQRKDLLAELDRPTGDRYASIVRSVTGMLGVGKTHLAAEYARARADDGWRLVGWINASDETTVLNGLTQVASVLDLKTDGSDAGAAGRAVRHRLEKDGSRCLVVFNDVADLDTLLPFLPVVGDARIVITTNLEAAANLGASVRVDVFSESDALAFLAERTGLADAAGAQAVTAELGCLPLALAQAAAVIAGQHLEYAVYLNRLCQLPVEQMLPPVKAGQYPRGVAAAVLLSLDGIRGGDDIGKVCIAVMDMVSVLASGGVPRVLLYTAAQSGALAQMALSSSISDAAVDEALGRLAGSSLLTFSVDDSRVSAHRLVMRVISDKMKEEKRITIVCEAVGEALISRAELVRQAWKQSVVSDLIDQINTLVEHMDPLPDERDNGLLRCLLRLRVERARFLDDLGQSPAQAVEDGARLLMDAEQKLGPDDPCTLTCRHNLAIAYQQAGRDDEAIKLYERNLEDRERILATDHLDTLTSRNSLATAYHDAGRDGAVKLYERNLEDRERILGIDHPDTRASRNNLATAYQDAGRIEEAIQLHEQNLPASMRILDTGQLDRNSLAIPLHELTRADGKRTIGVGHPDVLGYQNNLATAYFEVGCIDEATRLLERTYEGKERNLGPEHPSTLISQSNLAITYLEAGHAREAVELLGKALADCDRILGARHRTTRIIRGNLAVARTTVTTTLTGPG